MRFKHMNAVCAVSAIAFAACAPTIEQRRADATKALAALSSSRFEEADDEATRTLERDAGNPYAATVAAISRYKKAMRDLVNDVITVFLGAAATGRFNERYIERSFTEAEATFAEIDALLAVATSQPDMAIELCPACLEIDWNGNGEIDDFDARLLEVELDEREQELPQGDPRRRPTFRFDHGDFIWARAFLAFHRAALDLALAYAWSDVATGVIRDREMGEIRLRLVREGRVAEAKRRILEGLDLSDGARKAYLAETDDDREWLPNPKQKSHPLPMPVDAALYETWEGVVGDAQKLVRGEEGLDVSEIAKLGDRDWKNPPSGFIDIGRLLDHPRDLAIDVDDELLDLIGNLGRPSI